VTALTREALWMRLREAALTEGEMPAASGTRALHATLLEKSVLLVCAGAALLMARIALHRWWPEREEAQRA